MGLQAKNFGVVLMVLKSSLSNSHVISFSEPLELLIEYLDVPNLIGLINNAAL